MDVSVPFLRILCSLMLVVLKELILLHFESSVGENPLLVFERREFQKLLFLDILFF